EEVAEGCRSKLAWLEGQVTGRPFPVAVRRFLWKSRLGAKDPGECARKLTRLAAEQGVPDSTNTPISRMISMAVKQRVTEGLPGLLEDEKEQGLGKHARICRVAAQLLNQLYLLSGRHESSHATLAVPLTLAFDEESPTASQSEVMGCSMLAMLNKLVYQVACTRTNASNSTAACADKAYSKLAERD
ncbi:unnamed protein product, partial [Chrysoparadoxa australica]